MEKIKSQEQHIKALEAELDGRSAAAGGRKLLFGMYGGSGSSWSPLEPSLPGMTPGTGSTPRVILGIDVDYPPYGTLVYPPDASDVVVGGFGPDIAAGLMVRGARPDAQPALLARARDCHVQLARPEDARSIHVDDPIPNSRC